MKTVREIRLTMKKFQNVEPAAGSKQLRDENLQSHVVVWPSGLRRWI